MCLLGSCLWLPVQAEHRSVRKGVEKLFGDSDALFLLQSSLHPLAEDEWRMGSTTLPVGNPALLG